MTSSRTERHRWCVACSTTPVDCVQCFGEALGLGQVRRSFHRVFVSNFPPSGQDWAGGNLMPIVKPSLVVKEPETLQEKN